MKKRVIWKMFVLEIVTLGIYRLYWLIKTRREMMESNPEVKILSPWLLLLPIVVIVLAVGVMIVSSIQSVSELPSHCREYSSSSSEITPKECEVTPSPAAIVLFVAAFILIGPLLVIWLWGYSKGVETVTDGKMGFAIALLILYVVPDGIDILLVQDTFNKIGEKSTQHTPTTPQAA